MGILCLHVTAYHGSLRIMWLKPCSSLTAAPASPACHSPLTQVDWNSTMTVLLSTGYSLRLPISGTIGANNLVVQTMSMTEGPVVCTGINGGPA